MHSPVIITLTTLVCWAAFASRCEAGSDGSGNGYSTGSGYSGGSGYDNKNVVGTSYTQIASLPYGSGSTSNLYGSSGTNSYNPLPLAVAYGGGGGGVGYGGIGGLLRKKRNAFWPEQLQQLGIYSQAPAASYIDYGAPTITAYRYKRDLSGSLSVQPVYTSSNYMYGNGGGSGYNTGSGYGNHGYSNNGNNGYGNNGYGNNGYGSGYGNNNAVGKSYAQIGSLPYGSGSTNNLYGSSGTNSYNPLPLAVSYGGGGGYGGIGGGYGGLLRKKRNADGQR